MDTGSGILCGRPYGGIIIIWRKSFTHACTLKRYDDPRLLACTIETGNGKYFILNVYMPYQCNDNYKNFCEYLCRISAIITECDTAQIVIAGDFNAAINTPFEHELLEMCKDNHLIISDSGYLGRDSGTSTYVSAAHHTSSWLDHIICSHSSHNTIMI